MQINTDETILTGRWMLHDGRIVGDDVCDRINALTTKYLSRLASDWTGWEVLYRDPEDGRFWELTYPQGELQGGGPPQLRCLNAMEAQHKYPSLTL